jgi:hypothetical protein
MSANRPGELADVADLPRPVQAKALALRRRSIAAATPIAGQTHTMQLKLRHSEPGTRPSALPFDQGYLADIVKRLSFPRAFGTPGNAKAKQLVADEFLKIFTTCDRVGSTRNVCFGWPAEARTLVGAHFDSVPDSPGADDNASAVAVMLAVAKALGLRRDVMYVAFNAEECYLSGSLEFVKEMAGEMGRWNGRMCWKWSGTGIVAPIPKRTRCR